MELVSDHIDDSPSLSRSSSRQGPAYPPVYQKPGGFNLSDMMQFTTGQPHTYFHKLRAQAPVSWWPFDNIPPEMLTGPSGYWALTKYNDIKFCDQNPKLFSSQKGGILMGYGPPNMRHPRLFAASVNNLICLDQPFHIPLRMQHRSFFSAEFAAKLRERVAQEADRLIDTMARAAKETGRPVNLVSYFSEKMPLYTLCEMLGVDEKDRPKIVRWMHYLELAGYILANPDQKVSKLFLAKFMWNVRQMFKYGERVLAGRRKKPRDDLLTLIAQAELDGEVMNQSYLDGSWLLIVFAGNDTSRNSLSGTMRLLTEFPEQKQMALDDPSLIGPNLVPEALRMVSPVMYMSRTAMEDAELSGQKIAKDEKIVMWYGAANRDPDVFADPDRMNIQRNNLKDQLAFGIGPHVCLGQRIAAMQLQASYERILARYPNIKWTGRHEHAPNNFVHAISRVDVELGPPAKGA